MKPQFRFTINPFLKGILFLLFTFVFLLTFAFMFRESEGFDQIIAILGFLCFLILTVFAFYYYLLTPRVGMIIGKEGISIFGVADKTVLISWSDISKISVVNTVTNLNRKSLLQVFAFKMLSGETVGIYLHNSSQYSDLLTPLQNRKFKMFMTRTAWKLTDDFEQDIPDLAWPINTNSSKSIAKIFNAVKQFAPEKIQQKEVALYQGFTAEEAKKYGYTDPSKPEASDVMRDSGGNLIPLELQNQYKEINELNKQIESLINKAKTQYGEEVFEKAINAYFYATTWKNRNLIVKIFLTILYSVIAIFGSVILLVMVFTLGVKTVPITLLALIYLFVFDRGWGVIIYPKKALEGIKKFPVLGNLNLPWYVGWIIIPLFILFIFGVIGGTAIDKNITFLHPDIIMVSYIIFIWALVTLGSIIRIITYRKAKVIVSKYSLPNEMILDVFNHFAKLRESMQAFQKNAYKKGVNVSADFESNQ